MKIFRFLIVFLAIVIVSSMVLLNCKSKSTGESSKETQPETESNNQLNQAKIDASIIPEFNRYFVKVARKGYICLQDHQYAARSEILK